MKQTKRSVLLLLLVLLYLPSLAQDLKHPAGYLTAIGNEYQAVNKDTWRYISAVANGKSGRKIESRRKDLLATIKSSQGNIKRLPPFNQDPSLRDSIAAYLKLSYQVINEDYAKIVDMEEVAEQSYDHMEAYMLAKERANRKLDDAGARVNEKYKAFAEQNNIKLVGEQSKLGAKLERAGAVFEYYNKHYLIFFKSYKQEVYLLTALEKGDVNALEQNRSTLEKYAQEALGRLDTLPRYKSDLTLKQVNLQLQRFYKQEAEMVPIWVDFFLKKEKFEQTKKALDAKRQSDRTQADIDHYNAAAKEYNEAATRFNNDMNKLQKSRVQLHDQWNKTVDAFLSKHVGS